MVVIHKKHKETQNEKEEKKKLAEEAKLGIQDEFQAKGFELVSFVQTHKGFISSLILAFFLIGGVITAYFYLQQRKEEEASSAFFEAASMAESMPTKSPDDKKEGTTTNEEAIEKLKNITTDFSETKVATLAYLYLGKLYLEDKKNKEAILVYEKALEKLKTNNKLYPLGVIALAHALEANDQSEKALSNLEQLITSEKTVLTDLLLWEAARIAKSVNDMEKAKGFASKLLEEFPFSIYKNNAELIKKLN